MITKMQWRINSGQRFDQGIQEFKTSGEALGNMLEVELGWGAHVTELTITKVSLVTQVLNCTDYSVYEGSAEEMWPLYQLMLVVLHSEKRFGGAIADQAWRSMELAFGVRVKPLVAKMMGGLVMGNARLRVAVILSAGFTDESDVKLGLESQVSLKDLAAVADLAHQSGMPFREALALV